MHLRHLRDAVRHLRHAPLFTLTAVASLAIGIGANTAIFSLANALLLAPTRGVSDMARLVDLGRTTNGAGFDTVSYPTYGDVRDRGDVFDGVYAVRVEPSALSLGGVDGAERIYGAQVSASYFEVLGVAPAAGVFFRTSEEQLGVPLRKVVLSHAFWQRRFSADRDIVGQMIVLNGEPFTVTGVGPQGFTGTTVLAPDVWVPMTAYARGMLTERTLRFRPGAVVMMGARLKPGVSLEQAGAATSALMRGLVDTYPDAYRGHGLAVAPASRLPGIGREFVAPFISILLALVGLVLLVACTNLTGLLLARAAARSREIAVRLALGARRATVFSMVLTESLLLFALGAAAAVLVAFAMLRLFLSVLPTLPVQVALALPIDWRVLTFAVLVTLVTGVLTGAVPALQSARSDLVPDLKSDASGRRRQRLRHIFIAAQIACCLVLIVMAGLFIRALTAAATMDPGFQIAGVDVASVDLELGGYGEDRQAAVAEEIRERLAQIPGVASVGIAAMVALDGGGMGLGALRAPGSSDPAASIDTDWNVINPDYLTALRMPLVRGRDFSAADRHGAPLVAIVNEHLARAIWPGEDPIGKALENDDSSPGRPEPIRRLTVVGVTRDAKYRSVGEAPRHFIYVPLAQQPMRNVHYFVRRDDRLSVSAELPAAIRRAITGYDRNLPLVRQSPLQQFADVSMLPQRLAASVAGSLGVVALLLGAIGIYGVTAFAVARRTREIGVRMALGADGARVRRQVLWHGLRITAIGAVAGLAITLAATRLLTDFLFGISPVDPIAFGATLATLTGVALAASWIPAQRAARTDPMQALRSE